MVLMWGGTPRDCDGFDVGRKNCGFKFLPAELPA
jgi:hypothetical protein